jgi:hypothetical protein
VVVHHIKRDGRGWANFDGRGNLFFVVPVIAIISEYRFGTGYDTLDTGKGVQCKGDRFACISTLHKLTGSRKPKESSVEIGMHPKAR